jgi:hypothetical protein
MIINVIPIVVRPRTLTWSPMFMILTYVKNAGATNAPTMTINNITGYMTKPRAKNALLKLAKLPKLLGADALSFVASWFATRISP